MNMRAILFANGIMDVWPDALEVSEKDDMIIAVDGGIKHCLKWRITPHLIVGDMDSADPTDLEVFEANGARIHRFPVKKDETDLWLAIRAALNSKVDEVIILGALGARWDMTFPNVLALASPELRQIETRILDKNQEVFVLQDDQSAKLFGKKGDLLSLMPLTKTVKGVILTGFEYPLKNEDLNLGTTRGISNVFLDDVGVIKLGIGKLLVTITHGH